MTARTISRTTARRQVVSKKRKGRRPLSWGFFLVIVSFAFVMFGMVLARTALDTGAFQMAELERKIDEAYLRNQNLALQVAQLESPERIGELAEQMGMVFPNDRDTLIVQGFVEQDGPMVSTGIFALGERP